MSDDLTAALAVLFESLDDIRDDIRALRADVARLLSDSGTLGDDKAALVSALDAATQGLKFCVSELLLHAEVVADRSADLRLRAAIVAACGSINGRRLGKLLSRIEGKDVDGLKVVRVGTSRDGIIWQVAGLRV